MWGVTLTNKTYEQLDFVFLCDSNRKFIDTNLLCPKSTVKVIPCGTTDKAISILSSPRFNVSKALIIRFRTLPQKKSLLL